MYVGPYSKCKQMKVSYTSERCLPPWRYPRLFWFVVLVLNMPLIYWRHAIFSPPPDVLHLGNSDWRGWLLDPLGVAHTLFPNENTMNNQYEYAEQLRTTIWRTSGARFNAVRRFQWRERLSTVSISILAVIGIGFSILPTIYSFPEGSAQIRLYTFLGIAVGVSVLVISLLEGAGGFSVKAEQLHANARDLGDLQQKLALLIATMKDDQEVPSNEIENIRKEYNQRVQECPVNHSPLDNNRFSAQQRTAPEFIGADGEPSITALKAALDIIIYWLQPLWVFIVVWGVICWLIIGLASSISIGEGF